MVHFVQSIASGSYRLRFKRFEGPARIHFTTDCAFEVRLQRQHIDEEELSVHNAQAHAPAVMRSVYEEARWLFRHGHFDFVGDYGFVRNANHSQLRLALRTKQKPALRKFRCFPGGIDSDRSW